MISIKSSKSRLVKAIFGCFFGILGLISPLFASNMVFADEIQEPTYVDVSGIREEKEKDEKEVENKENVEENTDGKEKKGKTCNNSLGSLGWLVCPATGKISEAVDWLYEKNKDVLEINPVKADENEPIYQIWNYCLGLANIAFVIFLLIVIYSQITGVGITNYGIKKALPKLIIAAIVVNLSFIICSLAVDVSNIIGASLRGVFDNIALSTMPDSMTDAATVADSAIQMGDMYGALGEGALVTAFAGTILFEGGEIFLLIPTALAALVAVVVGIITIALRQVVVILLIMISPLAIVATILPNTENLFKKWKDLFVKMLVFYPMYSLLFGASTLAGWAIIATAKDGFGLILGIAVQIFPLFFSWSLMKMSGTFLGTIHTKLSGIFTKPLATNRAWAESHRELARQKMLSRSNPYTPSAKLRQYINDRKIAREAEIKEHVETSTLRGNAYATKLNYKKDGTPSKEGKEAYERLNRNIRYQNVINKSKADFEKGLGQLESVKRSRNFAQRRELQALDLEVMDASDEASAIEARMELIKYNNAKGRHERMNDAMNAHMDQVNGYDRIRNENGDVNISARTNYRPHFANDSTDKYRDALARYNRISGIMENNAQETQYAMANAAHAYDTNKKIYEGKMQKFFDFTVPTKDLENRLDELTKHNMALDNIDAVIAGMRVLNQRGDTDLVKRQLDQLIEHGVELGTRASQSIASFLMFDVKDNDPFLRRFGKYINLETARMYNENDRQARDITYDEYIKGYHIEPNGEKMYAKKDMKKLMEGTSLDNVERTAFGNFDESLMKAYGYKGDGSTWDVKGYLNKKEEIMTAFEPAFLSAMQKWQSGGEQINSGIKSWMGYELKQKKDNNGSTMVDGNGNPVYEYSAAWDDKRFVTDEDKKLVKDFYHRKTMDFVKDQTATQIQNMRTDVREPMIAHLIDEFLGDRERDPEGYAERKAFYENGVNEIRAKTYPGLTAEEADKKRSAEIKTFIRRHVAGVPYRKILFDTGKLEQMVTTKKSGGGNSMKDWNREMIGLDGENLAQKDVQRYKDEAARAAGEDTDDGADTIDAETQRILDDMVEKQNSLSELWQNSLCDENAHDGAFYNEGNIFLTEQFGAGESLAKRKFFEYYNHRPNATNGDLYYALKAILEDIENFR